MRNLASLINLKLAIVRHETKEEVRKRYITYCNDYAELGGTKTIADKIHHQEISDKYVKYMMERKSEW